MPGTGAFLGSHLSDTVRRLSSNSPWADGLLHAPRGRIAVVPIVGVGAVAAIQSSARECYNSS
jgi:hypothetical protein